MRNRNGFTLIEMVLVLAILMILSLAAYPRISGYMEMRREHYRQNQEYLVNKALLQYYAMTGRYCTVSVDMENDIDSDGSDEGLIGDTSVKAMLGELRDKTGAPLSAGDYSYWSRDLPASAPGDVLLRKVCVRD